MTMAPATNARNVTVVCDRPNRSALPLRRKSWALIRTIATGKAKK